MRNFNRKGSPRKFYQLNYRIIAPILRVIDQEGKQIGVINKNEAIKKAQDQNMDLVLISANAKPPVAKIINFKKFLYLEEKKLKSAKKGIKKSIVKDIKLSLFIAHADLSRLIDKGRDFLDQGSQLRLNLPLRGREITKRDMAFGLIRSFISKLGDVNISKEPRQEGRVIRAVVGKKK